MQERGGAAFTWTDAQGKPASGTPIWTISAGEGDSFAPSTAPFMINCRVESLHAIVKAVEEEGCNVLEKVEESKHGRFAGVIVPKGNKVELREPPPGQ